MNRLAQNNLAKTNSYSPNIRIFLLLGLITASIAAISMRLYKLQISDHESYLAAAATQHGQLTVIPPKRGEIYLVGQKDSPPLLVATNVQKNLVFAQGKAMSDADRKTAANALAPILGMTSPDLLEKMISGNQNYLPLKHQLSDDDSKKIEDLKLSGIHLEPESIRYYPQNNLASQVLGFLGYNGDDRVGQYGVEGGYEKILAGTPGVANPVGTQAGAVNGSDVYLTLDPAIQFRVQQILSETVTEHEADSGSAIVINPKTGAIMAMANFPDFDPNSYNKVTDASLYNDSAISSDYEPGSVFKAFTMAAGISENGVSPQSTYVDTGSIQVDDRTIKNSDPKPRGVQSMTQVLDESLNTGAVFVQQLIGQQKFKDYVQKFGFGKSTKLGLPGEVAGDISNLNRNGNVFYATASFGQGISTTPLQLVQAYTAIANGGVMVKPYIVDKIVHPDGTTDKTSPTNLGSVIDSKTASQVSAMLVDVVENGHGKKAAVKGYYIGGKTGTAQVAFTDKSGYDPSKNIGTFVGFGPVDNPAFLCLVRINEPKDVAFAESSAAPAFGEIASFVLNYLQIPPSR